jgi:hypothetical protein
MKNVRFKPWMGSTCLDANPLRSPLLILGESHYGTYDEDLTSHVIGEYVNGKNYRFFTTLMQVVTGKNKSETDRAEFWSSVNFYNFIQEIVGDHARIRPTKEMWQSAIEPFQEVIESIRPHHMLVVGRQLWGNLPASGERGRDISFNGQARDTWLYPHRSGICHATWVYHPANWRGESTSGYGFFSALASTYTLPNSYNRQVQQQFSPKRSKSQASTAPLLPCQG